MIRTVDIDDAFGIGLFLNPTTGQVMVMQELGVALGVLAWLLALVLGLFTAWLVLP